MKKLCVLFIFYFVNVFLYAQAVNYTVGVSKIRWREGTAVTGDCWEVAGEDYTALVWFNDNLNGTNIGGDCFTCGNNGDCIITPDSIIGGSTNTCAETIDIIFQAFENDDEPRCTANGGDDCRCGPEPVASINFRDNETGCKEYGPFSCRDDHYVWVEICWNYTNPANSNCTNPITINASSKNFILAEKCNGPDITSCTYNDYNDAWYRYTVGNNYLKSLQIDTEGSSFNTGLSVFSACGGNEIACDDNGGSGTLSMITLDCVPPGTTYYIRVSGYNGADGAGKLNITESLDDVTVTNSPVHTNIINGVNEHVAIPPCLRPIFIE